MILSIIYLLFSSANAWQTRALLQIQNKTQMTAYLKAKDLEAKCQEEALYLLFPRSCSESTKGLLRLGYINSFQANLRQIELEKKCSERISTETEVPRLILLDSRVEPSAKCKIKIEERLKDLLYSQS